VAVIVAVTVIGLVIVIALVHGNAHVIVIAPVAVIVIVYGAAQPPLGSS
jgi:hypothetical protein